MSSKLNLAGNYLSLPVNELGNEYRWCSAKIHTERKVVLKVRNTNMIFLFASTRLETSKDNVKT